MGSKESIANNEKALLFLVFSAGYEAGYASVKDLATAFEQWYEALKKVQI